MTRCEEASRKKLPGLHSFSWVIEGGLDEASWMFKEVTKYDAAIFNAERERSEAEASEASAEALSQVRGVVGKCPNILRQMQVSHFRQIYFSVYFQSIING